MTIQQAIGQLDAQKPNTFTAAEKLAWLSRLDGQVAREILGDPAFEGYTEDTPRTRQLLIEIPYDACYLRFLEAQIDYLNGEILRYKNAMALCDAELSAYSAWRLRQNLPPAKGFSF